MEFNKKILIIFCIVLFFLSSFCDFFVPIIGCISETKNPSVSIENLLSSPMEIELETQKIHLFGSFYPGQSCFKSCWTLNISLVLPESYKIERVWIINGKSIWEVDLLNPSTYVKTS